MSLKIGILGTRGIPNHYGGFEQCAAQISKKLVLQGHDVAVYNSHKHPYQEKEWQGVKLIHCFDPEHKIGTFGQFVYDFNCFIDSKKRKFDVLLQLGYTSNAILYPFWPSYCPNLINMDGLEWKRTKYTTLVRKFLKYAEGVAVKHANWLVADSVGIKDYLYKKYSCSSSFIPYGAIPFTSPDPSLLPKNLVANNYDLLIARMEKENSIECVIKAFLNRNTSRQLVLVGSIENGYGKLLHQQFAKNNNIVFLGGLYDLKVLNNLRYFSHLYYHGHTVGGTNPSLIEAMASNAMIIAHRNEFNSNVLEENAYYFSNQKELTSLIMNLENEGKNETFLKSNLEKVKAHYNWESVTKQYERVFYEAIKEFNQAKGPKRTS